LKGKEEKKYDLDKKAEIIRQIRELAKIPLQRSNGFDPTETAGLGLLEELSLAELRERLEMQKNNLILAISSKREENKLRNSERVNDLVEKANGRKR